jgi:hypothetical protein
LDWAKKEVTRSLPAATFLSEAIEITPFASFVEHLHIFDEEQQCPHNRDEVEAIALGQRSQDLSTEVIHLTSPVLEESKMTLDESHQWQPSIPSSDIIVITPTITYDNQIKPSKYP